MCNWISKIGFKMLLKCTYRQKNNNKQHDTKPEIKLISQTVIKDKIQ